MPASVRPKGSGSSRNTTVAPMSERQQMALLMQMTSSSNETGSRSPSSNSRLRDRNERGETPLHLAAIKGDVEQVCKLLAHRADPNVADFAGWTPLHEACNHGWYEVAYRLVQAGANVNARGLDNDTPLHDAAINGHLQLIKLLVEHGADIHAKNSKGKAPLDVAPPMVKPYLLNTNLPLPENTSSSRPPPRTSRDDKKPPPSDLPSTSATSNPKPPKDEPMEQKPPADDAFEFKAVKEGDPAPADQAVDAPDAGAGTEDAPGTAMEQGEEAGAGKRGFSEANEGAEEGNVAAGGAEEESRRKKRKEENAKEGKTATQRNTGQTKGQNSKQSAGSQNKAGASNSTKGGNDKKSPCSSPKPSSTDADSEDGKTDLKVPPLKIVIPQTSNSEQDNGAGRNGKSSSQRAHQALPYVVASSSNSDANSEKDSSSTAAGNSESGLVSNKGDEKKDAASNSTDEVPSTAEPDPPPIASTSATASAASTPSQPSAAPLPPPPPPPSAAAPPVELHPRKRKMKQSRGEGVGGAAGAVGGTPVAPPSEPQDALAADAQAQAVHPHDQPITNCYQLYLNIRNQIAKRRRGLFPVQPKPPQGFKDYLMNRCTYVLAGTAPTTPNVAHPPTLPQQMKELFTEQEKERYRLRTQHVIEKEKLVLSVEQEILRVHGRAARALANQSLPFSVCTILRDEEVYNLITPEQEEKDRNARSRYNGRLFLSWLQDVDDKWEKIKEGMLLRHHNEAESLHAVQKMDWEWKMKELSLCDRKITPKIEEAHVPMVHVSDDFDLLPA
ncbi:unnamed protein product [Phaedon cochleariae]|uniref:Ankyrin repeat domain-containing protein 12 n=1 Tax=Phaedon cochleariae TaxID=80249 RepID=A0A9P0DFM5_PHACE|nr:unnamed protein product [Phaedon cochleariae]